MHHAASGINCPGLESKAVGLPPPLTRDIPFRAYLCHRGVDPVLAEALANDFRHALGCEVIVQKGDGLSVTLREFREQARKHLEEGCDFLIVLLNENFPGSVYRQTLSAVEGGHYELPKGTTEVVRIDGCEATPGRYADVSSDMTQKQRRDAISANLGPVFR